MHRSGPLIRSYSYLLLVFLIVFPLFFHLRQSSCLAGYQGEVLEYQDLDHQDFKRKEDYRIVIDPGHGGSNYGVSELESDIYEKELTLDMARRLKDLIQRHTHQKVSLTREEDRELPVVERTTFANQHKADIFVSIHFNAHFHSGLDEFQIFTASYSDEERKDLSKNGGEWMAGQLRHVDDSNYLAVCIEKAALKWNLCDSVKMLEMPLQVLKGAHMPAVLVEAGFLTHAGTLDRLRSSEYRQKIAMTLFEGISSYIAGKVDFQNNMDEMDHETY